MDYIRFKDVILSTQYGYTAAETSNIEGKYKYFRITDIVPYFIDYESIPFCKIEDKNVEKYLLKEDDIIIARTGATTGYNYVVDKNIENSVFASYLIRFNVDKKLVYPKFLKYVLKSQTYYNFVNNYIGGSAQPGMNAKVFGRLLIPKFEYEKQIKIADALLQFDNLIENNNKRIKLLEQMAENLFKEWFVRFRFPGYESTSFNDGTPLKWKKCKLKDIAFDSSKSEKNENRELYDHYVPIDCLPQHSMALQNEDLIENAESSLSAFDKGDILFGAMRPYFHKVIVAPYKGLTRKTCFILNAKEEDYRLFLYMLLYQKSSVEFSTTVSVGSTMPYVRWEDFQRMNVILPTKDIVVMFNKKFGPMLEEIELLCKKNSNLIRQRDLLLPRLMSGKLEVK